MKSTGRGRDADPDQRAPDAVPQHVPAVRDLRLVVPTLVVFLVTAVTVGAPPELAAALAVVLAGATGAALVWASGAGVRAGRGAETGSSAATLHRSMATRTRLDRTTLDRTVFDRTVFDRTVFDRTALGVLAIACAVGAVAAGVQAARSHALAVHPLMPLVDARTGIEAVVTGFDRPVRSGGVMVPIRVEVTGSGASARAAELDVVLLAREGYRRGRGSGRRWPFLNRWRPGSLPRCAH